MSDPLLTIAAIHPLDVTATAAIASIAGVHAVADAAAIRAPESSSIVELSDGAQLLSAVAILHNDPVLAESVVLAPPDPLIAASATAASVQTQAAVEQANLALQHQLVDEAFSDLLPHRAPSVQTALIDTQAPLAANASSVAPAPNLAAASHQTAQQEQALPVALNASYTLNPLPLYANDPGVAAVVAAYHLNERIFSTPLDKLHERLPPVRDKVRPVAEATAVAPVGAVGSEQEQGGKHYPGNAQEETPPPPAAPPLSEET